MKIITPKNKDKFIESCRYNNNNINYLFIKPSNKINSNHAISESHATNNPSDNCIILLNGTTQSDYDGLTQQATRKGSTSQQTKSYHY